MVDVWRETSPVRTPGRGLATGRNFCEPFSVVDNVRLERIV